MHFWLDKHSWKQAARNTLNCLIGCSIGDFGTIIYFQHYYPEIHVLNIMPLAMLMGLITSILLETCLLKIKEGFSWFEGVKMAFSMSFLSMFVMELTENATNYALTGGTVSPSEGFYWIALIISLVAGFLVPLPYNYYRFKTYNQHCH